MSEQIKKLADLIEANPGCRFEIDNDVWYMISAADKEIATSEDFKYSTKWYG